MSDRRYNGWVNYETWLCNLWVDNDRWMMEELEHMARMGRSRSDMIDFLENTFCVENSGISENNFFSDLLSSALREVDFGEIVDHYIADNPPDDRHEDEDEDEDEA